MRVLRSRPDSEYVPESSIPATSGGNSNNIGTDQTEYPQLMSVVFAVRVSY